MRRVILILVIVLVLAGLGVGVALVLRQNTGQKQLARAQVAVSAQRYDEAIEKAAAYILQSPDDWRGYYVQAQAYSGLGRYDDARASIEKATKLAPEEPKVWLALSETYSIPARRSLDAAADSAEPKPILDAITRLEEANGELAKVPQLNDVGNLAIAEQRGLNLAILSRAWKAVANRYEQKAKVAEAARTPDKKLEYDNAASEANRKSEGAYRGSVEILLDVVSKDANRDAASTLAQAAIDWDDAATIDKLQAMLLKESDPPAVAAARLTIWKLRQGTATQTDIAKGREYLDARLAQHPDEQALQILRAQLALMSAALSPPDLSDLATAEGICQKILAKDPRNGSARLVLGNVLLLRGDYNAAEKELLRLKTDFPNWADAQFAYGRAALLAGYTEMAEAAFRRVTEIDPRHADARRYLADMLIRKGFYNEAFADAQAYYAGHPDDPQAVSLFVDAARQTDRLETARTALRRAVEKHGDNPQMLSVVATAYEKMGDTEQARNVASLTVKTDATDTAGRIGIAKSLMLLERWSEAEKLLTDECSHFPDNGRVHYELAKLFESTRRPLQAIDEFREAVRCDPRDIMFRLSLARALFNSGDMASAKAILDPMDSANPGVQMLRFQISLLEGKPVEKAEVPTVAAAQGGGLSLALAYLATGRPEECIKVLKEEEKKAPGDADIHALMGQAYLRMGDRKSCLDEWKQVIRSGTNDLAAYTRVAEVLRQGNAAEEVEAQMTAIPNARRELVDLAMGWLYLRQGNYEAAAEIYGRLADNENAPDASRNQARLYRGQALAMSGNIDRALAELDRLAGDKFWFRSAMLVKATILINTQREAEAKAVIDQLAEQAKNQKDASLLGMVAQLYSLLRAPAESMKEAKDACKALEQMYPKDANTYLVQARVYTAAKDMGAVVTAYRKALELQPGNFQIYSLLAEVLDRQNRPIEVLALLDQLGELGMSGQATSLYAKGGMYLRWGLEPQAIECFEKMAKLGYDNDPRIQLGLGRAFTVLGMKDRARAQLEAIPRYAPQFIEAQEVLATLAETPEEKIRILDRIANEPSARATVAARKMDILTEANKPRDAVNVLTEFRGGVESKGEITNEVAYSGLVALLKANDVVGAGTLCANMADQMGDARWRRAAVLLLADTQPERAAPMLVEPSKAGLADAVLGFYMAARHGNKAAEPWTPWKKRVEALAASGGGRVVVPPRYTILMDVAVGDMDGARKAVESFGTQGGTSRPVAESLVGQAESGGEEIAGEALDLLRITLASDLQVPVVVREWSLDVLKRHPDSQWAATTAVGAERDKDTYEKVSGMLKPADSLIAQLIRASVLMQQNKYAEAADLYGKLAASDPNNLELVFQQGTALERAGKLAQALDLYRKVYEASGNIMAANNAAYLTARLHPSDASRLAEAMKWADAGLEKIPGSFGLLDTRGWIAYLLRKDDQALEDLRSAVKGLPASPEVHYHLGMAGARIDPAELSEAGNEASVAQQALDEATSQAAKAAGATGDEAGAAWSKAVEGYQKALQYGQKAAVRYEEASRRIALASDHLNAAVKLGEVAPDFGPGSEVGEVVAAAKKALAEMEAARAVATATENVTRVQTILTQANKGLADAQQAQGGSGKDSGSSQT